MPLSKPKQIGVRPFDFLEFNFQTAPAKGMFSATTTKLPSASSRVENLIIRRIESSFQENAPNSHSQQVSLELHVIVVLGPDIQRHGCDLVHHGDRVAIFGKVDGFEVRLAVVAGVDAGCWEFRGNIDPVSYTHLRAHETGRNLVCRLLLEKKKKKKS